MTLVINGEVYEEDIRKERVYEILTRWQKKVPSGIYALQKLKRVKGVRTRGTVVELVKLEFDDRAKMEEAIEYYRLWGYKVYYSWEGVDSRSYERKKKKTRKRSLLG